MNAMLLAAGRGERMRPLTDQCPKPLLKAGGKSLLDWHLAHLQAAGCQRVVINTAWLGNQIKAHLSSTSCVDMEIVLSDEGEQALETAGGVIQALPLLGDQPFWLVNGDVWSNFAWHQLPVPVHAQASIVLVSNPAHHPEGDFFFNAGRVHNTGPGQRMTYAGMGCFDPAFFANLTGGVQPLAPLLRAAATERRLSGVRHAGAWWDVGTPSRLVELDQWLRRELPPDPSMPQ